VGAIFCPIEEIGRVDEAETDDYIHQPERELRFVAASRIIPS
jgi:hypothetical protein